MKANRKIKEYATKKTIFVIFVIFTLLFSSIPTHPAQAWMASEFAFLNNAIYWMMDEIKFVLVAAIKTAAIRASDQIINKMVGGGSGSGPMFITDWQDYLINQPARNAQLRLNTDLTQALRGKGNIAGYIPNTVFEGVGPGAFNTGMSQYGNYFSRLMAESQGALQTRPHPVTYEGNPADMFQRGTLKEFSRYLDGVNDPWMFKASINADGMQSLEEERDIYMAKALAGQGFIGKEKNGRTVTPGITIKDTLSNSRDVGNKIIAGASSISEVVMAAAIRTVTATIEEGIGNVQSQVERQVTDVMNRNITQMQNAVNTSGPGALYKLKP